MLHRPFSGWLLHYFAGAYSDIFDFFLAFVNKPLHFCRYRSQCSSFNAILRYGLLPGAGWRHRVDHHPRHAEATHTKAGAIPKIACR